MQSLIEILTEKTQSFKALYLAKTEEWATIEYARIKKISNDYDKGVYSIKVNRNEYYGVQKFLYARGYSIIQRPLAQFIEKELKNAEANFVASIEKLAFRVSEKGLSQNLKVEAQTIGINFDCVITDETKMVRAFTILAWGDIQRPHYRYLIK